MQAESNVWEGVQLFYKQNFGIPKELLDIMEIYDIILLCAEGKSNQSISNFTGIDDIEHIKKSLNKAYQFYGWDFDLDMNTRELYKRSTNRYGFISSVTTLSPLIKRCDAIVAYELNKKLDEYNKLLDKYEKG